MGALIALTLATSAGLAQTDTAVFEPGRIVFAGATAHVEILGDADLRTYRLSTDAILRDNLPQDKTFRVQEVANRPQVRSGNTMFDALYAMAVHEALQNSVDVISDDAYAYGDPIQVKAFQTGAKWKYVWTRDLAYALDLGLAGFDPDRAMASLLFKASPVKAQAEGLFPYQIVQDTGSGGSYPVSTDRVVWAIGAAETLKYLQGAQRTGFLETIYPYLRDTIEADRQLVFDSEDGLYRGEHSFLDWREQTYPLWTRDNVMAVAMSKALSVNVANVFLLKITADYAAELGDAERAEKYARWAAELREAVNERFFDAETGLYRTYLLSEDGGYQLAVDRYDLLGNSLAVLLGVADPKRAEQVIANYPTGAFGPPVIWPVVPSVPIYHNQGIWPFVTAYWTKAAHAVGNPEAVNDGMRSLMGLAAVNLSNMENFDFRTGSAHVKSGPRVGPTINSRRQLWSVAGYLAMVQDVVFGLETSEAGIRFSPGVTPWLRNSVLAGSDQLSLRNFAYQGTVHNVIIHLPEAGALDAAAYGVVSVKLNGREIESQYVGRIQMEDTNTWDIVLSAKDARSSEVGNEDSGITRVDVASDDEVLAPVAPQWDDEAGPITVSSRRIQLHFEHADSDEVRFNIYRNGELHATDIEETSWIDPESADFEEVVYSYSVEAVGRSNGLVSHPTASRSLHDPAMELQIPARSLNHQGGNLVDGHHFENWGRPDDSLQTKPFAAKRTGHHFIKVRFSNGSGAVNTGITCAVKRLEVSHVQTGQVVALGYLVLPQSGDWSRWDWSNVIEAPLRAGQDYTIRIYEDRTSLNMSYLESNHPYVAYPGGGEEVYNYVNIADLVISYQFPFETGN